MLDLHFDRFGDEGEILIIIHGLFGSASNFRGLARRYSAHYKTYCLDLRNHGLSFHDDDISYEAMASDVIGFMDKENISKAHIMGHSMGGKVAMQVALNYPKYVDKLIIGDIAPTAYPPNHQNIFDGLNAINLDEIKTRSAAEIILKDYVEDAGVRIFLLTNLVRNKDQSFRWRINLAALEVNYEEVAAAPKGKPFLGKTLFIRGELSAYVPDAFKKQIAQSFPNYTLETLSGVGHWLHAEKPIEYSKLVTDFLES